MTGEIERYAGDAVILATGGYGTVYYLSTNAVELQRHGGVARAQARRALREPVLHADPPDVHPGDRRSSVEAHADERKPAQRRPRLGAEEARATSGRRNRSPKTSATTTSSASTRASATSCRATSRRATPSRSCDDGRGVGESGLAVYLDFKDAIKRLGPEVIKEKYGNLFHMYQKITDEDPYKVPMRIYPAIHYTMGGLWVDYNLMSNDSRAARARRSELLRPRRQPARRERADAGARRRLLRHPVHDRRLPREHIRCRR